jgi:hypothetical protein
MHAPALFIPLLCCLACGFGSQSAGAGHAAQVASRLALLLWPCILEAAAVVLHMQVGFSEAMGECTQGALRREELLEALLQAYAQLWDEAMAVRRGPHQGGRDWCLSTGSRSK